MAKKVLTQKISEPIGNITTARIDINAGDGNLTIDQLENDHLALVSGTLEYLENQGLPTSSLVASNRQANLSLKGGSSTKQSWFRLPWATCNGATEWVIHINPNIPSNLTAHSDGGNVRLNLAGMSIIHLSADTGGGNMEIALPDHASNLNVIAKTGAGNVKVKIGDGASGINILTASSGAGDVQVRFPAGMAARIHVTNGLGKAILDPQFTQTDKDTYQSPGFENADNKIEMKLHSGAGNVSVLAR